MKNLILFIIIGVCLLSITACGGSSKCKVCHGSGYFQKRTCVFCSGSGYSDNETYNDLNDFVYGK